MKKYRYEKRLSKDLRHGTAAQRIALLKWMRQPKFRARKPTPDELVEECLDTSSPLYGLMQTGQKAAAQAYWRQTAQDIIRHIEVVKIRIKTNEIVGQPVRAWVPITTEEYGRIPEENYIPTQRAMGDPGLCKSILEGAHRDFMAWFQRYADYAEFLNEFSAVIEAYKQIRQSALRLKSNGEPQKKSKRLVGATRC